MLFYTNNDDYIKYTNPIVPLIYIIRPNQTHEARFKASITAFGFWAITVK